MDRISDATRFWIESDIAEQFERARGQIAASWIENRVVVRERHVFEPRGRDIFIKRRPPAVATLKTQLPIERAPKSTFQSPIFLRPNESQCHQHHRGVVHAG